MDEAVAENMLIIGSSQSVGTTEPPLLVIEGISKVFGHVHAVDNLSLSIPGGQFVGVIGRSGAGKSTLLRLLNRLTEPTGGRVVLDGTEVTALHGRKLRDWRRRCAMVFQQFNLVGRLDVMNNALMGRLAYAPGLAILEQAVEPRGQDHRDGRA
jgi:phosphonate transport system ATP-binding protein